MDYVTVLQEGTVEIFETMVMLPIVLQRVTEHSDSTLTDARVTGMIGFGGTIKGMIGVSATADMAKIVTGSLLGMEIAHLDDDVKDAFGEIANMIAGALKSACGENGIDIDLAIPNSVVGDCLHISGLRGAKRVVLEFSASAGKLWIELKYLEA
ncbi:chemotaxis protein CheX [Desulfofustis glycolicus DSM 9705]|uniref:Chemotaxis protein CheX n=1 Tax=Desulfofustis glycolicus DSM 9705 TaxID=1121409 RepID=A0A1M5U2G8_9BACT|nr:chemotaxis protein CheX [Desulfofustis glycolicus DSM 9705]